MKPLPPDIAARVTKAREHFSAAEKVHAAVTAEYEAAHPHKKIILTADEYARNSNAPIEIALRGLGIRFDAIQPSVIDFTMLIRADADTVPEELPHWLKIKHL